MSGIVIWGLHRDTAELITIRLPVFSLGALPVGPQRLDPRDSAALASAACGPYSVTADDFVLGDDDGVLFIPWDRAADVAEVAATIRDTERAQAARMHLGIAQKPGPLRRPGEVHGAVVGQQKNCVLGTAERRCGKRCGCARCRGHVLGGQQMQPGLLVHM